MKKITIQLFVIAIIAISIWSCSTKKDAFLNRTFHGITTKNNVLYNGRVAYDAQKKQIDDSYVDDFYNTLPIEPLKVEEEIIITSFAKESDDDNDDKKNTLQGFKKAEEKAVKAIQKHSMDINNSEKNKQIDDAYFLLGKARYYDQRFIPALETFKYMIKRFPNSKLFNQARIWEAKTLIRLGNEDDAIYKLDRYLTRTKDLPNKIRDNAHTALAMAFTEQDSTQQIINNLNKALLYTKNNHNQETRNSFVLAQLYRKQNKIDSSNSVFDKITSFRKAPYRYKIYAQIERAKNYNKTIDNTETLLASLKKLTKNRDNRPYLDGIFFQLGKINLANDSIDVALNYFKKSILTKQAKDIQKNYAYEELGNIYFDKANFQNAGSYYDSVLDIAKNKNTKRIKKLTRKRKSLDEVIRLENIATKNDSILDLVAMSKDEQINFFKNYIEKLKKKNEEERIIAANNKVNNGTSFGENSLQSAKGSKFYFYNNQSVSFGQQEFQKIWGNRKLSENWRISNKKAITNTIDDNLEETTTTIDASKKYDIAYYVEGIPTDLKKIDSISNHRNKAYYNLGLIYKEQFNKFKLATTRLEKLLTLNPKENLVLPSYYHLYKSFEKFDKVKSDYYKNKITVEYPESRYAQIINNPDISIDELNSKDTPTELYKATYTKYLNKEYKAALADCEKYSKQLSELPIIPKFELLKAQAIAKLEGKMAYITALKFVTANYPNTQEGKRANEILNHLNDEKEKVAEIINTKETSKKLSDTNTEKINRKAKKNKLPSKKEMLEKIRKQRLKTLNRD